MRQSDAMRHDARDTSKPKESEIILVKKHHRFHKATIKSFTVNNYEIKYSCFYSRTISVGYHYVTFHSNISKGILNICYICTYTRTRRRFGVMVELLCPTSWTTGLWQVRLSNHHFLTRFY